MNRPLVCLLSDLVPVVEVGSPLPGVLFGIFRPNRDVCAVAYGIAWDNEPMAKKVNTHQSIEIGVLPGVELVPAFAVVMVGER